MFISSWPFIKTGKGRGEGKRGGKETAMSVWPERKRIAAVENRLRAQKGKREGSRTTKRSVVIASCEAARGRENERQLIDSPALAAYTSCRWSFHILSASEEANSGQDREGERVSEKVELGREAAARPRSDAHRCEKPHFTRALPPRR